MKKTNSKVLKDGLNNQVYANIRLKHEINSEAPEVTQLMQGLKSSKDENIKTSFKYWHMKTEKKNKIFNNVRG